MCKTTKKAIDIFGDLIYEPLDCEDIITEDSIIFGYEKYYDYINSPYNSQSVLVINPDSMYWAEIQHSHDGDINDIAIFLKYDEDLFDYVNSPYFNVIDYNEIKEASCKEIYEKITTHLPKVIEKLLNSNNDIKIELGLNLLKTYDN
jgi:hypothetical protein